MAYTVEVSPSGRAKCKKKDCEKLIAKGELRLGVKETSEGGRHRFGHKHIKCIPKRQITKMKEDLDVTEISIETMSSLEGFKKLRSEFQRYLVDALKAIENEKPLPLAPPTDEEEATKGKKTDKGKKRKKESDGEEDEKKKQKPATKTRAQKKKKLEQEEEKEEEDEEEPKKDEAKKKEEEKEKSKEKMKGNDKEKKGRRGRRKG